MRGIRSHECPAMLRVRDAWPKKEYHKMLREFGRYLLCPFCYEPVDREERERRAKITSLVNQMRGRFG